MIIIKPLPNQWPVSQVFGAHIDDYRDAGFAGHEGLDYSCPVGTPVWACTDGTVIFAGPGIARNNAYGNYVIVDHGKWQSWYCHLSEVDVVVGQAVTQHQVLGLSGNTGKTTGPHLHWMIRVPGANNGSKGFVDPWALRIILGDA